MIDESYDAIFWIIWTYGMTNIVWSAFYLILTWKQVLFNKLDDFKFPMSVFQQNDLDFPSLWCVCLPFFRLSSRAHKIAPLSASRWVSVLQYAHC